MLHGDETPRSLLVLKRTVLYAAIFFGGIGVIALAAVVAAQAGG